MTLTTLTRRLGFVAVLAGVFGGSGTDADAHTVRKSVSIRSWPRTGAKIRTKIKKGTVVNVVKKKGTWTYINRPRAKRGWLPSKYLKNTPHYGRFPRGGRKFTARGTGYYPSWSGVEGGYRDRKGNRLRTLQAYLAGRASYVSVAMDRRAFRYGTKLRIRELERRYRRIIIFKVVDTGGAFRGRGTRRIDICVANRRATMSRTVNRRLQCMIVR